MVYVFGLHGNDGATGRGSDSAHVGRVTRDHGRIVKSPLPASQEVMATLHPSAILRAATDADRESQMQILIADLSIVAKAIRH